MRLNHIFAVIGRAYLTAVTTGADCLLGRHDILEFKDVASAVSKMIIGSEPKCLVVADQDGTHRHAGVLIAGNHDSGKVAISG